jgi:hypothetical protein
MLLAETQSSLARPVMHGARKLCGPGNMICGFQNVFEGSLVDLFATLVEVTNDLLKSQHEWKSGRSKSGTLARRATAAASASNASSFGNPAKSNHTHSPSAAQKILTPVALRPPLARGVP